MTDRFSEAPSLPSMPADWSPSFDGSIENGFSGPERSSNDIVSRPSETISRKPVPLRIESLPQSKSEKARTDYKQDDKLVIWDGPDDPAHPKNMNSKRKWAIAATTGLVTFSVSFASSIVSAIVFQTSEEFGVSVETMFLGISLYVLGFAFGPLLWGPMSELYGRTRPMLVGMIMFCFFQIPFGLARNLEAIFICRFFAGVFGAAPMAILAGVYADIFNPLELGVAGMLFYLNVFSGPCLGPIIGTYIVERETMGWRWTAWITMIMAAIFTLLMWVALPESYEPLLLRWKAEKLRQETKDWSLHAKSEEQSINFQTLSEKYLRKPMLMIIREPILIFVTIYMSLVYALLYLTFEAFPISFFIERRWSFGTAPLPFLGVLIGIFLACFITAVFTKTWYMRRLTQRKKVLPEDRLPLIILGSFIVPIALFWFAWSSHPSTLWVSQCFAAIFIGTGILLIFMNGFNYLIDVYQNQVNSAVVANTFIRSVLAAGFAMAGIPLFSNLGVDWGTSLIAFFFVALLPFPILFWFYGAKIRSWSRFALA